ncbi:hypothetical protein CANARDRAFT_7676 [[Candida] arabinofermentans NRRL YB-2248]|uniref:Uncharacterized protein n=1 Tax=[Candida] arabinofermentans NRRL YB-2248 TaxID=983967 RepID=A0A1E4T1F7_9ASCO|nr:hypothetical protein CANARDRAFT_7676 [[Candida] arabinofermentans NRRL YB-2248]
MKWKHTTESSSDQINSNNNISSAPQPLLEHLSAVAESSSTAKSNDDLSLDSGTSHKRFSRFKFGKKKDTSFGQDTDPLSKSKEIIEERNDSSSAGDTITDLSGSQLKMSTISSPSQKTKRSVELPSSIFERSVEAFDLPVASVPTSRSVTSSTKTSRKNSIVMMPSVSTDNSDHMPVPLRHQSMQLHQESPSSTLLPLPLLTRAKTSSVLSSCQHPHHLLTENYTSPILDSTVELISNKNMDLDSIDIVQYPHRLSVSIPTSPQMQHQQQHQQQNQAGQSPTQSPHLAGLCRRQSSFTNSPVLFSPPEVSSSSQELNKSQSQPIHASLSRSLSSVSYNPFTETPYAILNSTATEYEIPTSKSPKRKSISFYSYSDLVNYERCRPTITSNTANSKASTAMSTSDIPLLTALTHRKPVPQGQLEDIIPTDIDETLILTSEDIGESDADPNESKDDHSIDSGSDAEHRLEMKPYEINDFTSPKKRFNKSRNAKETGKLRGQNDNSPVSKSYKLSDNELNSVVSQSSASATDPDEVREYFPHDPNGFKDQRQLSLSTSPTEDCYVTTHDLKFNVPRSISNKPSTSEEPLRRYPSNHNYFETEIGSVKVPAIPAIPEPSISSSGLSAHDRYQFGATSEEGSLSLSTPRRSKLDRTISICSAKDVLRDKTKEIKLSFLPVVGNSRDNSTITPAQTTTSAS